MTCNLAATFLSRKRFICRWKKSEPSREGVSAWIPLRFHEFLETNVEPSFLKVRSVGSISRKLGIIKAPDCWRKQRPYLGGTTEGIALECAGSWDEVDMIP